MANPFDEAADVGLTFRRAATVRALVLLAMCLAVLIAQIDTSVVNLATHAIGATFHAGVGSLQWVLDAYNLVYAALLLTGGLIADLYGRRRAFAIGIALMAAGSLVCAFAPDITVLIAGRAATGLAAALLLPSSLAIIRVVWPEPVARGRVLGIWASCNGLAFAVGPTLGGVLIEDLGWRSVFLLAVPLASAGFVLAVTVAPESTDPQERHFDLAGQLLGALTMAGVALAAIAAHDGGSRCDLRFGSRRSHAADVPLGRTGARRRGAGAARPVSHPRLYRRYRRDRRHDLRHLRYDLSPAAGLAVRGPPGSARGWAGAAADVAGVLRRVHPIGKARAAAWGSHDDGRRNRPDRQRTDACRDYTGRQPDAVSPGRLACRRKSAWVSTPDRSTASRSAPSGGRDRARLRL